MTAPYSKSSPCRPLPSRALAFSCMAARVEQALILSGACHSAGIGSLVLCVGSVSGSSIQGWAVCELQRLGYFEVLGIVVEMQRLTCAVRLLPPSHSTQSPVTLMHCTATQILTCASLVRVPPDICKLGESATCPAAPPDLEPIEHLSGEVGSVLSSRCVDELMHDLKSNICRGLITNAWACETAAYMHVAACYLTQLHTPVALVKHPPHCRLQVSSGLK